MNRAYDTRIAIERLRLGGSVSERHAARIAELEAVVGRLLANEAKLIADSVTMDRQMLQVLDCISALREDAEQAERDLRQADIATFTAFATFRSLSFWGRVRWVLTGR